jgi:putative tryptophan/tyrosine transport system substrate-binding protein
MRRRGFIAGLGSGAIVAAAARPPAVLAQQRAIPTVGVLHEGPFGGEESEFSARILEGLAEMGFVEGHNITLDQRFADGHTERLPALAADLVLRNPAVIVANGTNPALAAKTVTRTVPFVFTLGSDPVEIGLVASFNRPGGNFTGVTAPGANGISEKRLDLLHKLEPAADLIGYLVGSADSPYDRTEIGDVESASRALGVRLLVRTVSNDSDIAAALRSPCRTKGGRVAHRRRDDTCQRTRANHFARRTPFDSEDSSVMDPTCPIPIVKPAFT